MSSPTDACENVVCQHVIRMLDGEKVRARREQLGLLQKQLAGLVGILPCTISKIERRKGLGITLTLALSIAWALRCNVSDLL